MAAAIPLSSAHIDLYKQDQGSSSCGGAGRYSTADHEMEEQGIYKAIYLFQEVPAWPCIPNGLVVRYDGTVAPCCAGAC